MPICIYPQTAKDFSNNGLGILTPLECKISEEAAGKYELELVHPIDDTLRWAQIQCGCIIRAPAPVRESPLYEITEDITEGESVTVTRKIYRANTRHMYLRKEPKTDTQKLTSLPVGAQVVLLEHSDGGKWAHVAKVDGGQVGYCPFNGLTYVRDQQEVISQANVIGQRVVEIRQSREQLFRIYSVEKDTEAATVTVKAMHIFYDLRGNIIDGEYAPEDAEAATVVAEIGAKLLNDNQFTIHAERIIGKITADYGFKTPVEALLDPDEGIVAQTGCICVRDNYDVFLLPDDVRDMGVTIRRGKNLVGVTVSTDDSDVVTRIIPVGKNKDGDPLYIDSKYVDSPRISDYPFPRAQRIEYDVSVGKPTEDDDGNVFKTDAEAKAELVRLANQDFEDGCDLPTYGMDVDFVLLENTEEYQHYASLQAVHLYDTVTVIDEMIGVKAKVRATGYTWDALAEQYESVTLGELQDVQQTVYSYNLPDKGISGNKISNNTMPGAAMRNASIEYAKISVAAINQLSAQAITALTARIQDIVAHRLTTDELYAAYAEMIALRVGTIDAGNIQTDELAAELARITVLVAGTASFDRATVQHLVAQAMNLEFGTAGQVFIRNLAVEYAQMVGAAIGNLCIRASDGNYYRIDVQPDGTVSAERTTVSASEIAAGQTEGGRVILETNITAANLSAGNLLATYALVNRIDAARLDVDALSAREAFVDLLRTSRIYGGKSIEMIVGNVDASARIFRQEDAPGGGDGVKNGDLWVIPSTGQTWQATALDALGLRFAVDGDGNLCYEIDGDAEGYALYLDGADLRAEGFAFPLDADGVPGAPYVWALVRDAELERNADAASNRANEALDIANAALSQADFQRVIRQDAQGLHVGDNKTGFEVLIDSASVNVMSDGEALSTFSDKYVRLDNMQIHKVRGGLAISVYNGRR